MKIGKLTASWAGEPAQRAFFDGGADDPAYANGKGQAAQQRQWVHLDGYGAVRKGALEGDAYQKSGLRSMRWWAMAKRGHWRLPQRCSVTCHGA